MKRVLSAWTLIKNASYLLLRVLPVHMRNLSSFYHSFHPYINSNIWKTNFHLKFHSCLCPKLIPLEISYHQFLSQTLSNTLPQIEVPIYIYMTGFILELLIYIPDSILYPSRIVKNCFRDTTFLFKISKSVYRTHKRLYSYGPEWTKVEIFNMGRI